MNTLQFKDLVRSYNDGKISAEDAVAQISLIQIKEIIRTINSGEDMKISVPVSETDVYQRACVDIYYSPSFGEIEIQIG